MNIAEVGKALEYEFNCTRRVDGATELYDPTVVKCSFLHEDMSEEVYTYSGTDPNDEDLVRVSTGVYRVTYTPTVAEARLRVRGYTEDVVSGKTWVGKAFDAIAQVNSDPRNYTDTAAPTP